MSELLQTGVLAGDNLRILAYMQHMAQTAQPEAAKRLFELFAQQHKQRIEAIGQKPATPARGVTMKKSTGSRGKRVSFEVTA